MSNPLIPDRGEADYDMGPRLYLLGKKLSLTECAQCLFVMKSEKRENASRKVFGMLGDSVKNFRLALVG